MEADDGEPRDWLELHSGKTTTWSRPSFHTRSFCVALVQTVGEIDRLVEAFCERPKRKEDEGYISGVLLAQKEAEEAEAEAKWQKLKKEKKLVPNQKLTSPEFVLRILKKLKELFLVHFEVPEEWEMDPLEDIDLIDASSVERRNLQIKRWEEEVVHKFCDFEAVAVGHELQYFNTIDVMSFCLLDLFWNASRQAKQSFGDLGSGGGSPTAGGGERSPSPRKLVLHKKKSGMKFLKKKGVSKHEGTKSATKEIGLWRKLDLTWAQFMLYLADGTRAAPDADVLAHQKIFHAPLSYNYKHVSRIQQLQIWEDKGVAIALSIHLASDTQKVVFFELSRFTLQKSFVVEKEFGSVVKLAPMQYHNAVICTFFGGLRVFCADTWICKAHFPVHESISCVKYVHSAKLIVVGTSVGQVYEFDTSQVDRWYYNNGNRAFTEPKFHVRESHSESVNDVLEQTPTNCIITSAMDNTIVYSHVESRAVKKLCGAVAFKMLLSKPLGALFTIGVESVPYVWISGVLNAKPMMCGTKSNGHNDRIVDLSLLSDATFGVTMDKIGGVKCWDLNRLACIQSFDIAENHPNPQFLVYSAGFIFNPVKGRLITVAKNSVFCAQFNNEDERKKTLAAANQPVTAMVYVPSRRVVITAAGPSLTVWNESIGKEMDTIEEVCAKEDTITSLVVSTTELRLYVGTLKGAVFILNLGTLAQIRVYAPKRLDPSFVSQQATDKGYQTREDRRKNAKEARRREDEKEKELDSAAGELMRKNTLARGFSDLDVSMLHKVIEQTSDGATEAQSDNVARALRSRGRSMILKRDKDGELPSESVRLADPSTLLGKKNILNQRGPVLPPKALANVSIASRIQEDESASSNNVTNMLLRSASSGGLLGSKKGGGGLLNQSSGGESGAGGGGSGRNSPVNFLIKEVEDLNNREKGGEGEIEGMLKNQVQTDQMKASMRKVFMETRNGFYVPKLDTFICTIGPLPMAVYNSDMKALRIGGYPKLKTLHYMKKYEVILAMEEKRGQITIWGLPVPGSIRWQRVGIEKLEGVEETIVGIQEIQVPDNATSVAVTSRFHPPAPTAGNSNSTPVNLLPETGEVAIGYFVAWDLSGRCYLFEVVRGGGDLTQEDLDETDGLPISPSASMKQKGEQQQKDGGATAAVGSDSDGASGADDNRAVKMASPVKCRHLLTWVHRRKGQQYACPVTAACQIDALLYLGDEAGNIGIYSLFELFYPQRTQSLKGSTPQSIKPTAPAAGGGSGGMEDPIPVIGLPPAIILQTKQQQPPALGAFLPPLVPSSDTKNSSVATGKKVSVVEIPTVEAPSGSSEDSSFREQNNSFSLPVQSESSSIIQHHSNKNGTGGGGGNDSFGPGNKSVSFAHFATSVTADPNKKPEELPVFGAPAMSAIFSTTDDDDLPQIWMVRTFTAHTDSVTSLQVPFDDPLCVVSTGRDGYVSHWTQRGVPLGHLSLGWHEDKALEIFHMMAGEISNDVPVPFGNNKSDRVTLEGDAQEPEGPVSPTTQLSASASPLLKNNLSFAGSLALNESASPASPTTLALGEAFASPKNDRSDWRAPRRMAVAESMQPKRTAPKIQPIVCSDFFVTEGGIGGGSASTTFKSASLSTGPNKNSNRNRRGSAAALAFLTALDPNAADEEEEDEEAGLDDTVLSLEERILAERRVKIKRLKVHDIPKEHQVLLYKEWLVREEAKVADGIDDDDTGGQPIPTHERTKRLQTLMEKPMESVVQYMLDKDADRQERDLEESGGAAKSKVPMLPDLVKVVGNKTLLPKRSPRGADAVLSFPPGAAGELVKLEDKWERMRARHEYRQQVHVRAQMTQEQKEAEMQTIGGMQAEKYQEELNKKVHRAVKDRHNTAETEIAFHDKRTLWRKPEAGPDMVKMKRTIGGRKTLDRLPRYEPIPAEHTAINQIPRGGIKEERGVGRGRSPSPDSNSSSQRGYDGSGSPSPGKKIDVTRKIELLSRSGSPHFLQNPSRNSPQRYPLRSMLNSGVSIQEAYGTPPPPTTLEGEEHSRDLPGGSGSAKTPPPPTLNHTRAPTTTTSSGVSPRRSNSVMAGMLHQKYRSGGVGGGMGSGIAPSKSYSAGVAGRGQSNNAGIRVSSSFSFVKNQRKK